MIIIDNFLPQKQWQWLLDNKDEIFSVPIVGDLTKYKWMNWVDTAHNKAEDIVNTIHKVNNPIKKILNEDIGEWCKGFEYWTNTLTPDDTLHWHVDKDEYRFNHGMNGEPEGKTFCPKYSTVLYVEYIGKGGCLEISEYTHEHVEDVDGYGDIEFIKPVPNRLVIFDPKYWHRVGNIQSVRKALTINLWDHKMTTWATSQGFTPE